VAGFVKVESTDTPQQQKMTSNENGNNENNQNEEKEEETVFPHIVGYYEVSSLMRIPRKMFSSRNPCIDQLKDAIYSSASEMLSHNPRIPRKWIDLHNFLIKKVDKQYPIITYQEFSELAHECGFETSRHELDPFLLHYKSCGELLYYFDVEELSDIIIIDPQWLSNQLCAVISFSATHLVKDGIIDHAQLEGAWRSIDPHMRGKVLSLFRQAGIFIPFSESSDLIPCRLPIGRPSDDIWPPASQSKENQVSYCFKFNNLPPSFFSYLISLVESKQFRAGKMAPLYYSNHIVYVTQSTGIPCDLHTNQRDGTNLSLEMTDTIARDVLAGGVKLSRFLSLDAGSVDSLLDSGRNSIRVSMIQVSDFHDVVLCHDSDDHQVRHRVHFELLPHLKCIIVSIRGPTPCCLAPETIDLLNRVRLTRYNAVSTEFSILCPVGVRKLMPDPCKFELKDLYNDAPVCEKGHDMKSWEDILMGVCDYRPVLTPESIITNLTDFECPKLFMMMPVNLQSVGLREFYTLTYLKEGYSVHLLCEFPDCWHFLTSPGYRLARPKDFVRKYGRRLQTLLRVLSKLKIPARITGLVSDTANNLADLLESLENLADDLEEHLADFTDEWSNFKNALGSIQEDELFLKSNEGLNRREFRSFLNKADEEQRFGDLIPTFKNGKVVWLCETHSK